MESAFYDPHFLSRWSQRLTNPLADLETFRVDETSYLYEIGSPAHTVEEIQGQYMGLLKIDHTFWPQIAVFLQDYSTRDIAQMDRTTLLKHLLLNKVNIKALPYHGKWGEIDHPSDVALYEQQIMQPQT
jgi:L-glutamine-phosphate cytidylyltransferase